MSLPEWIDTEQDKTLLQGNWHYIKKSWHLFLTAPLVKDYEYKSISEERYVCSVNLIFTLIPLIIAFLLIWLVMPVAVRRPLLITFAIIAAPHLARMIRRIIQLRGQ